MTLTEQNPVSHLLDDMVKCQHCGTSMASTGENYEEATHYVCQTKAEGCDTPDVEAEPFNRLIIGKVLEGILDSDNTRKLVALVREAAMEEIDEYDDAAMSRMQAFQSILDELRKRNAGSKPTPSERNSWTRVVWDVEDEHLESRARAAQRWETATQPDKVAEYAHNPDTFLRPGNIRTTKAIMELAIREIFVGPESATIRYTMPMPPGNSAKAQGTEEVTL